MFPVEALPKIKIPEALPEIMLRVLAAEPPIVLLGEPLIKMPFALPAATTPPLLASMPMKLPMI